MQKALISFFAIPIVFALLMDKGALFHSLVASPMNECNVSGSLTENGLRHASGPVPLNHQSVTIILIGSLIQP